MIVRCVLLMLAVLVAAAPCEAAGVDTPAMVTVHVTPSPQLTLYRAKRASIADKLSPAVIAKLTAIVHSAAAKPTAGGSTATLVAAVRAQFPNATPDQANLLAFVTAEEAAQAALDAQNSLSAPQQLQVQMSQQSYTQAMEMLSNIMKAISSTAETIVSNLES